MQVLLILKIWLLGFIGASTEPDLTNFRYKDSRLVLSLISPE